MHQSKQILADFFHPDAGKTAKVGPTGDIIPVEPDQQPSEGEGADRLVQGLFITHINLVRGFIRGMVRDRHLADDILQETFITVTRKAEDFQAGTNFPRWVCAIARLKVLEGLRRQRGQGLVLSEEAIEALAVSDHAPGPDVRLDLLNECLSELPPAMKRSLGLRYEGNMKPAEIARMMGWKAEAVYVALSRARHLLRECIERKTQRSEGHA